MAKGRKDTTWRRMLNWLAPVQRRRFMHAIWLEFVVVGSVVLVVSAAYGVASVLVARHHNTQRQSEALRITRNQLKALQASNGLASGDQCFDATGASRTASEAGAPCSYTSKGVSGCLSNSAKYCYEVKITKMTASSDSVAQPEQLVTYQVVVSWSGRPVERGQVATDYRVVESNSSYAGDLTGRSGSGGSGDDATIGVADGVAGGIGTTEGGKYINTLADIAGGPSVSVSTAVCSIGSDCVPPKNKYDLAGHFAVRTNIPDKLIASCSWDFGDGSPTVQLTNAQKGCFNEQIVNHSYASTWQMRPLPDYPLACASPLGMSLNSYTFLVHVTLHTTSGVDVSNVSPQYAVMPSCSA